ncbi:MAG: hypothetical protein QM757_12330 [Paludibaculum sp.]
MRDGNGRSIENLTARDFTILEDGVPQKVAFAEFQQLPDDASVDPAAASMRAVVVPRLTRTQIAAERPGEVRYRDRRLLVLYFDMTAMPAPDQVRALRAAQGSSGLR